MCCLQAFFLLNVLAPQAIAFRCRQSYAGLHVLAFCPPILSGSRLPLCGALLVGIIAFLATHTVRCSRVYKSLHFWSPILRGSRPLLCSAQKDCSHTLTPGWVVFNIIQNTMSVSRVTYKAFRLNSHSKPMLSTLRNTYFDLRSLLPF